MLKRDPSDAIWINREQKQEQQQSDPAQSSSYGSKFSFVRSMSLNSEGLSTSGSSPPSSPFSNKVSDMIGSERNTRDSLGSSRSRTSSFSSGYGPSYGHEREGGIDRDPNLTHSPLSTSAPHGNLFRRSNSISVGVLENRWKGSRKNFTPSSSYDTYHHGYHNNNNNNPLGPIEEMNKMNSFGDAFKRSMGQLFNAPKMPTAAINGASKGTSPLGGMQSTYKERKNGQMTDQVVSLLCENAIR